MGQRDVKRVALDFDWPLNEVWKGYTEPWEEFDFPECSDCEGTGYGPEARRLRDRWYGYIPFDPAETGSTPFTRETPEVREWAEWHVKEAPGFYGSGESAILRECDRLCTLWNSQWSHHLSQEDVDALVAADRLMDLTHTWDRDREPSERWQPTGHHPTAEEVNRWSIRRGHLGHDCVNCYVVVGATCERMGVDSTCATCGGHGNIATDAQREAAERVETYEPPAGDGWQLWETTSEGSPISPVFPTAEELAEWAAENATVFAGIKMSYEEWLSGFVNDRTDVDSIMVLVPKEGS